MTTDISSRTGTTAPAVPRPREAADSERGPAAEPPILGGDEKKSLPWRLYDDLAELVDHVLGWDRLPKIPGLVVLIGVRNILRQSNLHDPSTRVPIVDPPPVPARTPQHLVSRSADGTYNDLDHPDMGMAGARFGRNIPLDQVSPVTEEELLRPSPREVSRRLLTRTE